VQQNATDLTKMKTVQNIQSIYNLPKPTSTQGGIAGAVDAYDGTLAWTFANPTKHWGDVQVGRMVLKPVLSLFVAMLPLCDDACSFALTCNA